MVCSERALPDFQGALVEPQCRFVVAHARQHVGEIGGGGPDLWMIRAEESLLRLEGSLEQRPRSSIVLWTGEHRGEIAQAFCRTGVAEAAVSLTDREHPLEEVQVVRAEA